VSIVTDVLILALIIALFIHATLVNSPDEGQTKEKLYKSLKVLEVAGLWAAAGAGLIAIFVANQDASEQRGVMANQLDAIISEQRAWLKINAIPRSVRFDKIGNGIFDYGFRIENVGHSVATQTRVEAKIIAIPHEKDPLVVLIPSQEAFCTERIANKATENMDKTNEGFVLFPGEHYPTVDDEFGGSTSVSKQEILDSEPFQNGKSIGPFFVAYLIGCVTYKLNLGERRHKTGFIYEIARTDPSNGRKIPMGIKIGSDLEPPDLAFMSWYFGSGKID
jgi:hypothetical protein